MARDRIRVMHVITRLVRGGAQRVALDIAAGLPRDRFRALLVAGPETGSEGSLWHEAEALELETQRIPTLVRAVSPLRDLRALHALRALIRRVRPHVVHAHTSKAGLLGCAAARREGVPAVVLAPHGHILGRAARIPGVPSRGPRRWLLGLLARRNAGYADLVIAPNEVERQDGIRLGLWSEEKSVAVPNGIDTARFVPRDQAEARRSLGLPRKGRLVGVVARLTPEKGVDLALEALARLPGAALAVVGDGPGREALERQAGRLGLSSRVSFLGLQDRVEDLLPAFDALLIPSRTEAHGLVAAEAAACGIPVVAARAGGLESLVVHERTGLLVPPADPRAMAAALQRLLADEELARTLGLAGRAHVVESFSRETMLRRTAEVYETLLSASGGKALSAAGDWRLAAGGGKSQSAGGKTQSAGGKAQSAGGKAP